MARSQCVGGCSNAAGMRKCINGPLLLLAVAVCMELGAPLVLAALPGPVKECAYSDKTTAEAPCEGNLYVGQHMTYQCGSGDTPEPAKANAAGGNYCPTPLDDGGKCANAAKLDEEIATTSETGGKVTLRMKEDYTAKFKEPIKFHVRCQKSGASDKVFVALTLWPFTAPMTAAPTQVKCENANDTGTTYLMRCNFFIYKAKQIIACADSGTPTTVPTDVYSQSGKVCSTGFKNAGVVCEGDKETAWNTVANGVVITAKNSNQDLEIDPAAMKAKRAVVYIGCKKGSGTKNMFSKGLIFNHDFVKVDDAHVKMIKHVCTPEKGKSLDTPCEVTLAADEAAVMVCTPFAFDYANYKLMPDDTNSKDGKFCTTKPTGFDADCKDTKKWADDAKAAVSMDGSMDFFIVAFPKANAATLKTQVVAYGYCSNKKEGLAWKVTLGSSSSTSTSSVTPSAAAQSGPSGVAVAAVTLIGASLFAAAAM